jgi:hypothetical protein
MVKDISDYENKDGIFSVTEEDLAWRIRLEDKSYQEDIVKKLEEDYPDNEISVEVSNIILVLKDN